MKRTAVSRVICALMATLFAVAFTSPAVAFAEDPSPSGSSFASVGDVDLTRSGSITINIEDNGEPVEGVVVRAWKIASLEDGIPLVEPFASAHLQLTSDDGTQTWPGDENSTWGSLAESLFQYAGANNVPASAYATTSANGSATMSNLEPAIYLVVPQTTTTSDGTVWTFSPSIVSVPSNESGALVYDVTIEPKHAQSTPPSTVTYRLVKYWDDTNYENLRPSSVDVVITRDGETYQTVTLSADNDWSFSWTSEPGHEWNVSEVTVNDYYLASVAVEDNGETIALTNHVNTPPELPDTSTNEPPTTTTTTTTTTGLPFSGGTPFTGDPGTIAGWLALAGVVILVIVAVVRKRSNSDTKDKA